MVRTQNCHSVVTSEDQVSEHRGVLLTGIGTVLAKTRVERIQCMTKNLESMNEAIRNPKHGFRKTFFQPKKQLRHRHERRKIKEFLHLSDWIEEEAV